MRHLLLIILVLIALLISRFSVAQVLTDAADLPVDSLVASPDSLAADTSLVTPLNSSLAMSLLPPCARPDSNFLRFPSGISSEFIRVIDRLDSILLFGKGRLQVLHIGGSHVQADMYTDVFRRNLDSLNNGLRPPRGFIFPYAVAKTNNPFGYKTTYRGKWGRARNALRQFRPALGLGGIAVFTQDPSAYISINMNRDLSGRWSASSFLLLARSHGHLTPVITSLDGVDTLITPTPTPLGFEFKASKLFSQFRIGVAKDSAATPADLRADSLIITGIIPDNPEDGIVYHTVGVNGASVPSYLGCSLFDKELDAIRPDLVILAIGINDANDRDFDPSVFISNYNTLLRSFRRANPDCAFLFITNNDSYRRIGRRRRVLNKNGAVAQAAFYELARQWQGGVWDLYEIMGGENSMTTWNKAGLARKDRVHFTNSGYQIVGSLFYNAFLNFYLDQDYVGDDL